MSQIATEVWISKLKAAFDAGYYRTESAEGLQTPFPWQNKRCRDCPFWLNGVCRVRAAPRGAGAHTCSYFQRGNQAEAQDIIDDRMEAVRRLWWKRLGNT